MDTERTRTLLQDFAFQKLFIEELGWNQPDVRDPFLIEVDDCKFEALAISELSGVRIFQVTSAENAASSSGVKFMTFAKRTSRKRSWRSNFHSLSRFATEFR